MIACAYTPGRYAELAQVCRTAWASCGIEMEAFEYPDAGSWDVNVLGFVPAVTSRWDRTTPLFIIGVDTYPSPFVEPHVVRREIDALAKALRSADVICEHRPNKQANMKVHSGIVGWAPSAIGIETLDRFVDLLNAEAQLPNPRNDQEILYGLLIDMEKRGGNWHRLREGYNCKHGDNRAAIIMHGHASRGRERMIA